MKKILTTVVMTTCLGLLIVGTTIALLCSPLAAVIPGLHATSPMVVLSGSMAPALPVGGMVFVRPADTAAIRPGDIITFSTPRLSAADTNGGSMTTHRVTSVRREVEGLAFTTKGDANNAVDSWTVPARSVRGVVVFTLPLLGYLSVFARSRIGFALLVLLPALLLILAEGFEVVRELAVSRREPEVLTTPNVEANAEARIEAAR